MLTYIFAFKELFYYILLPLILCLIIFEIAMIIDKRKENNSGIHEFRKAYFGNLIYLVFSSMLLSASLGYAVVMIKNIIQNSLIHTYFGLLICSVMLPIVTLIFFLLLLNKFTSTVKNETYFDEEFNEKK